MSLVLKNMGKYKERSVCIILIMHTLCHNCVYCLTVTQKLGRHVGCHAITRASPQKTPHFREGRYGRAACPTDVVTQTHLSVTQWGISSLVCNLLISLRLLLDIILYNMLRDSPQIYLHFFVIFFPSSCLSNNPRHNNTSLSAPKVETLKIKMARTVK